MEEYESKIGKLQLELTETTTNTKHQYQKSMDHLNKTTLQLQAQMAEYHLKNHSQNEVWLFLSHTSHIHHRAIDQHFSLFVYMIYICLEIDQSQNEIQYIASIKYSIKTRK